MFTIKPAVPDDYFDIKEIHLKYGKPLELSSDKFIMVARENGFAGIGVYEIKDGNALFSDILMTDEKNTQMKYFIAKAVLNSVDLKGFSDVYSENAELYDIFNMCGFEKLENGMYHLNLARYFTGCETCKN